MDFYPFRPPLVGFVGSLLLSNTKLFAPVDAAPAVRPPRIQTLDGLHGFLALGVVFLHGAAYHR
jgi:hypothetical protein